MQFNLTTLIGKLNPICRKGLEEAAGLCVSQTNYNVEIEHLLLKLLEQPDTDLQRVLHYYEVNVAVVPSSAVSLLMADTVKPAVSSSRLTAG